MHRRDWLAGSAALLLAAAPTRAASMPRLAAAWDDAEGRHHAGWLQPQRGRLQVLRSIELPTRAHGLWIEPDGALLVVARRPGEWLLRWRAGAPAQWCWSEPERRFCGHVIAAHGALYTTEAELDSGAGRVVRRDARSLAPLADGPSHGIDPHQLLSDADGSLLVANGGVPTRPESGRLKLDLDRMDPSLVRLDAHRGTLLGQWRLPDPRLSIRHLARHADGTVGIALQSEHDDVARRAAAPLLALFDGHALRGVEPPRPLAGYAGDIAATRAGFVLAATRAGGLAHWRSDGTWGGFDALPEACALAARPRDAWWAGGHGQVLQATDTGSTHRVTSALRLDNHWLSRD
ncbi:DUF1513 domain-containing protein [Piscinibacter defluvii]|uniref:DUF1513 domain-containing protein n=1 Tax=Piscinibacter defluvii TaxID=1796922 RepID=UPI001F0C10AD|nr:DUF1513 domain-containing protein [Piscinibacter defluvii]